MNGWYITKQVATAGEDDAGNPYWGVMLDGNEQVGFPYTTCGRLRAQAWGLFNPPHQWLPVR